MSKFYPLLFLILSGCTSIDNLQTNEYIETPPPVQLCYMKALVNTANNEMTILKSVCYRTNIT